MAYPETMSELANYPKALSHAGTGGGGFALKSISFTNATKTEAGIYKCINAEGKYIQPASESGELVKVPAGETVTVYYAEPVASSKWEMGAFSTAEISLRTNDSGIAATGTALAITAEAPDGAKVIINDGGDIS